MAARRIVLVAFYAPPYKGVGALRAGYWWRELPSLGYQVELVTATPSDDDDGRVVVSPAIHLKPLRALLQRFIGDPGYTWSAALTAFFRRKVSTLSDHDVIIFSCGPFFHLACLALIKRTCRAKIIVDMRDPWANNPATRKSWLHNIMKVLLQRRWLKHADAVVTVNTHCRELLRDFHSNVHVIENGYDDVLMNLVTGTSASISSSVIVSGKPYGLSMKPLLSVTKKLGLQIIHCGATESVESSEGTYSYYYAGFLSQHETYQWLKKCSVAVIYALGMPFQTTTKVYDYIGFEKKIIIISAHKMTSGALYDLLESNPNVYWSTNDVPNLEETFKNILKSDFIPVPIKKYARIDGLKKLVNIADNLAT